jgi:hypothetical protein
MYNMGYEYLNIANYENIINLLESGFYGITKNEVNEVLKNNHDDKEKILGILLYKLNTNNKLVMLNNAISGMNVYSHSHYGGKSKRRKSKKRKTNKKRKSKRKY